jgi:hypothetical protein
MADLEYRRLTRAKSRALFGIVSTTRSSLWLGKDHLLQIDTSGYTESYKRFYFADIQALVMCRTEHWLYQAVVFAALACFFALIGIFGGGPVIAWIFGILAGLFALCLLLDLTGGPSSKCYVRTAVQTEALVSLTRLRRARRTFDVLRPLITAAQGELKMQQPASETAGQPAPPVILDMPPPGSEPILKAQTPEIPNQP